MQHSLQGHWLEGGVKILGSKKLKYDHVVYCKRTQKHALLCTPTKPYMLLTFSKYYLLLKRKAKKSSWMSYSHITSDFHRFSFILSFLISSKSKKRKQGIIQQNKGNPSWQLTRKQVRTLHFEQIARLQCKDVGFLCVHLRSSYR